MAMKAVTPRESEGNTVYDFVCPVQRCGGNRGPFESLEWPNRKDAEARARQHLEEHETSEPMPELAEFMGGAE